MLQKMGFKKKQDKEEEEKSNATHWEVQIAACKYHAESAILDMNTMNRSKCDPQQKEECISRSNAAIQKLSAAVSGYDCSKERNSRKIQEYLYIEETLTTEHQQAKAALASGNQQPLALQSCVMDPLTMTAPNMTCVSLKMLDSVANMPYGGESEGAKSQAGGTEPGSHYEGSNAVTPLGKNSARSFANGGGGGGGDASSEVCQPLAPPAKMLETAIEIQSEGLKSLQRSEALTIQMQQEAQEISQELSRQAEQQELINEDLHLMDKQIKTARREVYKLTRDVCGQTNPTKKWRC